MTTEPLVTAVTALAVSLLIVFSANGWLVAERIDLKRRLKQATAATDLLREQAAEAAAPPVTTPRPEPLPAPPPPIKLDFPLSLTELAHLAEKHLRESGRAAAALNGWRVVSGKLTISTTHSMFTFTVVRSEPGATEAPSSENAVN